MKYLIIIICCLFISSTMHGQDGVPNTTQTNDELKAEIQALKDSIAKSTNLLDQISNLSGRLNRDLDGDKKERVQLGLSFGYSEMAGRDLPFYRLPTINTTDSTLSYQQLDGQFVLVSTTMTITPFLYSDWIGTARTGIKSDTSPRVKLRGKNKGAVKGSGKGTRNAKRTGLWILENTGFSVNINFLEIATGSNKQSFNQTVEGGIGISLRLNKNIYASLSRELKFYNSLHESFEEGDSIFLNGNKIGRIEELSADDQNYYHTKTLQHSSFRLIVNF